MQWHCSGSAIPNSPIRTFLIAVRRWIRKERKGGKAEDFSTSEAEDEYDPAPLEAHELSPGPVMEMRIRMSAKSIASSSAKREAKKLNQVTPHSLSPSATLEREHMSWVNDEAPASHRVMVAALLRLASASEGRARAGGGGSALQAAGACTPSTRFLSTPPHARVLTLRLGVPRRGL